MIPDNLRFWISVICGTLTMVTSFIVLRKRSPLDNPVIAICVGGLTFIGFMTLPDDQLRFILISYVALAITLIFLPIVFLFGRHCHTPAKPRNSMAHLETTLPQRNNHDVEFTQHADHDHRLTARK